MMAEKMNIRPETDQDLPDDTGWETVAEMADKMEENIAEIASKEVDERVVSLGQEDEDSVLDVSIATDAERTGDGEIDYDVVSQLDEYMMSSSEDANGAAHYVADMAGVAAGVKPAALIQVFNTDLNLASDQLAKMLRQAGMKMAEGWEDGKFFISKDLALAQQTKEKFQKLWNGELSDDENRELGRLLGYPASAAGKKREMPKTFADKLRAVFQKKVDSGMERYYVHTPEHQAEEFEQYERPLHEYMERFCPKASAVLKAERTSSGKPYKWL